MIRMRTNKEPEAVCYECGNGRKRSLELFDVCIGEHMLTICDVCNEHLFRKTLSASCRVSERVKKPRDMDVISGRSKRKYTETE